MPVTLQLEGFDDFLQTFRDLPVALADQARGIVHDAAEAAYQQIRAGYPVVSGQTQQGMQIHYVDAGPLHPKAVVENRWYVSLFLELGVAHEGTSPRFTRRTHRSRGSVPPRPHFFPIARAYQRAMDDLIAHALEAAGFTVTGGR